MIQYAKNINEKFAMYGRREEEVDISKWSVFFTTMGKDFFDIDNKT